MEPHLTSSIAEVISLAALSPATTEMEQSQTAERLNGASVKVAA